MPLSLDAYSTWAQTQGYSSNELAALKREGHVDRVVSLKETTSALARFFDTRSVSTARRTALEDFTQALTERFGEKISARTMAVLGAYTAQSKGLTAHIIQRAIATAENMRTFTGLKADGGLTLRVLNGTVDVPAAVYNGLSRMDSLVLRRSILAQVSISRLLGQCPIGDAEVADFRQRAQQALSNVNGQILATRTLGDSQLGQATVNDLVASLEDLKARLTDKLATVDALNADDPLSAVNKERALKIWHGAAQFAMARALARYQGRPEFAGPIQACKNLSFDELMQGIEISEKTAGTLAERLATELQNRLPARCTVNVGAMEKLLMKGYQEVLNTESWAPIHKQFEGSLAGRAFKLTSDIVPGRHLGEPIAKGYDRGVNGYMCHSADTKHAVNLATSKITVDAGTGAGPQVAFSGVRHGVHSAWEIADEGKRQAANLQRAKEAVIAAYLANPDAAKQGPDGVLNLPMTSVSLLTPDWGRSHLTKFYDRSVIERALLQDQLQAWRDVGREPIEVTVNGQIRRVKPQVIAFNFGVNVGAVKYSAIPLIGRAVSGWGFSDPINREAFNQLEERVNAFPNQPGADPYKAAMAKKLCEQLKQILSSDEHHRDSHDAYKAAARVAVITHLIDGVPCWNCKSGKDRTGEMDVECKFLATLVALKAPIPDPGQQLNESQKALFRSIALQSGNLEMQRYNTGLAGFKTGSVNSIGERLGGGEAKKFHKGGSSSVAV